ncbi:N-acetylmuramoyl-L-alanine amidase [Clostridium sporogenes]|uniref:N-acetylmuramoyl-L-alanine amidase n=1 Tax=Clostridium sporogenes TaxID=1509 RepID=UPI0037EF917C|nr:N-acetylmuramoyl-L-alanine amidase [Clostridium sporogenes]
MDISKIKNIFKSFLLILLFSTIINFVPSFKVHASSTTTIMGRAQLTQDQAFNYFRTRNTEKSDQAVKNFISIVWEEANLEGIKPDVVFIQIMKETNFLKFTGDVKESQNNFAGIGATGGGVAGASFKDVRTGVRAVVQHLKAYCSTEALKSSCVDPRFTYVKRGISPYVEWLGIGENPNYPDKGWAADNNYGKSIVEMMNSAKYMGNAGDSQGNIDISKATINSLEVSLNGNKVANNELEAGKTYNIKAFGNSSNGVLYEYWIKDLSINSWIKLKDYSTSTQVTWTPNKSGKYLVGVHVKDKYSTQRLDDNKYVEYNVSSAQKATINNLEVSLNGNKVVNNELEAGKTYNIKAFGNSSNGVLYEYWIKDLSINSWIKLKDYSTSTQVTWTPNKSGKYLIGVHVKDKYSTQKLDNYKYVEYNVKLSKEAVISNLEVSLNGKIITNNQLDSGKTYSIKAYAESFNGVLYEYWIKDLSINSWIKLKDYSTSTQVTWTPNKAGKYLIGVHVKDKYSTQKLDNYKYVEYSVQGSLIKTIVLDAGHGGRDSGAVSSQATGRLHEADIVQKITIKLGNVLKKAGYNVIYTRDKIDLYNYPSVTQNLEDRINVANSIKADLFMSIHADSFDVSSANGYSAHYSSYRPKLDNSGIYEEDDITYDKTPCDAALKSKVLSQLIVNEMSSLGGSNRGISDHNLYVTKNALMPSVLIETGFVSNDTEVRKLNSDSYQNQIVQKLYNAVTKLFSM